MKSINNLGLGTAALGRPQYINLRQDNRVAPDLEIFKQNGMSVLEKAYQAGIRYFDTAPGYGLAESLVLEWLRTKDDDSIKIGTKWGYTYVANFNPNAKVHEIKEHSLKKLNEQWKVSKNFLPHLKIYQIHSATLESGVLHNEEVLDRLAFLKAEYNMKIGITTTGPNQIEVIKKALDIGVENRSLFDSFQVTYNILDQSLKNISTNLLNQGKSIIVKEALANGRLFRNSKYGHYNDLYTFMEKLANKYKVGVDAISLNFCSTTMPKSIVLSGVSDNIQLDQNVKVATFQLTEEEIHRLIEFRVKEEFYWNERKELIWN